jgi:hypothetical protein
MKEKLGCSSEGLVTALVAVLLWPPQGLIIIAFVSAFFASFSLFSENIYAIWFKLAEGIGDCIQIIRDLFFVILVPLS